MDTPVPPPSPDPSVPPPPTHPWSLPPIGAGFPMPGAYTPEQLAAFYRQPAKPLSSLRTAIIGIPIFTAVVLLITQFVPAWKDLDVVASEELVGADPKMPEEQKRWKITGSVHDSKGGPVPNAFVTLIGITARGDQKTSLPVQTNEKGGFQFEQIHRELQNETSGPVREMKVAAYFAGEWYEPARRGNYSWTVGSMDSTNLRAREIGFSIFFLLPLCCFLLSLILIACFSIWSNIGRWYHSLPCLFAILATGSMVGIIGYSIMWINEHIQHHKTASLGFIHFYENTYVKGGTVDWLVSLTSPAQSTEETMRPAAPPAAAAPLPLATGFGAPLWVVFVAVLGSGLLTIVLVMGEVIKPLPPGVTNEEQEEIQRRFRTILEHQFFVLFSPLGGIILYQLMLAGGAAGQPVVVAITVLGAGATLNGLLVRAVRLAEKWILSGGDSKVPEKKDMV